MRCPAIEATLTMAPPPRARMWGSTARMPLKAPVRLTAMTRSQSCAPISAIIRRTVVPAPLTRMSIPPQASVMPSANLTKASRSATSSACAAAWQLRPVISAATASAAASRSRTATCPPAAAKARQVAAPMPLPPPVTRATFPVKSSAISSTPSSQLVEQRLCVLKVGRVEPFGEPAVNRREEGARFGAAALVAAEPGEAHGGAQFPELGLLLHRDAQGFQVQLLGGLAMPLPEQQLAFVPVQLGCKPTFPCSPADLQSLVQQGQCFVILPRDLACPSQQGDKIGQPRLLTGRPVSRQAASELRHPLRHRTIFDLGPATKNCARCSVEGNAVLGGHRNQFVHPLLQGRVTSDKSQRIGADPQAQGQGWRMSQIARRSDGCTPMRQCLLREAETEKDKRQIGL